MRKTLSHWLIQHSTNEIEDLQLLGSLHPPGTKLQTPFLPELACQVVAKTIELESAPKEMLLLFLVNFTKIGLGELLSNRFRIVPLDKGCEQETGSDFGKTVGNRG